MQMETKTKKKYREKRKKKRGVKGIPPETAPKIDFLKQKML